MEIKQKFKKTMNTKNIFTIAAAFFALLVCGGCSPIASPESEAALSEKLPSFIKISKFELGNASEQRPGMSDESHFKCFAAPFVCKLEAIENSYDKVGDEYDWRKDGNIRILKVNVSKGEKFDAKGKVFVKYDPNNKKMTRELSIQFDNFSPTSLGKDKRGHEERKVDLIVKDSIEEQEYRDGYKKMISQVPELIRGVWETGDGGKLIYDKTNVCRIEMSEDSIFKREWKIYADGTFNTSEGYDKTVEKIVRINEKEWVSSYSGGIARRTKVKSFEELEEYRKSMEENIRKNLTGVWRYKDDRGNVAVTFLPDGSTLFQYSYKSSNLSGKWGVEGDEYLSDSAGVIRYYKVALLDEKNLRMVYIKPKSREGDFVWICERVETLEEYNNRLAGAQAAAKVQEEKKKSETLGREIISLRAKVSKGVDDLASRAKANRGTRDINTKAANAESILNQNVAAEKKRLGEFEKVVSSYQSINGESDYTKKLHDYIANCQKIIDVVEKECKDIIETKNNPTKAIKDLFDLF